METRRQALSTAKGFRRRPEPGPEEVHLVARGIATAVSPGDRLADLTDVQAALLSAVTSALTGYEIDYRSLEPLGPEDLADCLAARDEEYRQRIVHHMVLGELVLRPLPAEVALRVAKYAKTLGIDDKFVRVARRYAQGAYGLAWKDLKRSGFTEHWQNVETSHLRTQAEITDPLGAAEPDPELEAAWLAFGDLTEGTLGRQVYEMYTGRGFPLPGAPDGASAYLAQHDFAHVLADYGTNLKGELEVFTFIGRADPDPKGFAWLATLVGLFETGYIENTGFFERDIREEKLGSPGMHHRVADAIRRGRAVCERMNTDLLTVDFHELAPKPVEEVRERIGLPPKSKEALEGGSPGLFDREGMTEMQLYFMDLKAEKEREAAGGDDQERTS